jgi:hypothetical protein
MITIGAIVERTIVPLATDCGHGTSFPLHLISALVFTAIMVFVVNNRNYPVCNDGDPWWRAPLRCGLTQSDVTSLISFALVLIRLVTSAWFTTSAWRGTYILLEKRGMTLAQMRNMVTFH